MLYKLYSYVQRLALTLLFIAFMNASCAYANDETKRLIGGIAAGIIGMALDEHSKQGSQEETKQIEQKTQQSQSTLQYQDNVAEAQLKLKKIGYYNGKIDGLKGRGTTEAIRSWEYHNVDASDGEISNEEMKALTVQASHQENQSNNNKVIQTKLKGTSDETEKEILDLVYGIEASKDVYALCSDFINSKMIISYAVDSAFENNYQNVTKALNEHLENIVECHGISEERLETISTTAKEQYRKSEEAKIYKIAIAMGSRSLNEEQLNGRVKGCNVFSQTNVLTLNKTQNEKLDQKSCEASE